MSHNNLFNNWNSFFINTILLWIFFSECLPLFLKLLAKEKKVNILSWRTKTWCSVFPWKVGDSEDVKKWYKGRYVCWRIWIKFAGALWIKFADALWIKFVDVHTFEMVVIFAKQGSTWPIIAKYGPFSCRQMKNYAIMFFRWNVFHFQVLARLTELF